MTTATKQSTKAAPTEQPLREGRFEIGDIDLLLDLISSLESDPIKAFVQFVLNSFDAYSTEDLPNRTEAGRIQITFKLQAEVPEIVISDYNSRGMNLEQIEAIPTKIGSSEKRAQWQQLIEGIKTNKRLGKAGYQAVGIYVYRRLCKHARIVTRHFEEGAKTYSAILPTTHGAPFQVFQEPKDRSVSGTDVHLVGVNPAQWKKTDVDRMIAFFRKEFRHQLRSAQPPIELFVITEDRRGQGNIKHQIQPAKFEGERRSDETFFTKWTDGSGRRHTDPTELELYFHPGVTGGKVEVWFGQTRITEDITRIEGLDIAPFNSGELEGTVTPTFLLPDMDRHDFMRDPEGRFESWLSDITSFAKRLIPQLESSSREARTTEHRQFERDLRLAVQDVADTFSINTQTVPHQNITGTDEMAHTPPGKIPRVRRESEVDQETRDAWKSWVWDLLDQGVTKIGDIQDRIHRDHRVKLEKERINLLKVSWENKGKPKPPQPVIDGEQRQRRAEVLAHFSISFQIIWSGNDDRAVRSRYNAQNRVIEINTDHPDYVAVKREESNGKKGSSAFYRYVAEQTVKELTPIYFEHISDPCDLMDRFMDLRNGVMVRLGFN